MWDPSFLPGIKPILPALKVCSLTLDSQGSLCYLIFKRNGNNAYVTRLLGVHIKVGTLLNPHYPAWKTEVLQCVFLPGTISCIHLSRLSLSPSLHSNHTHNDLS